MSITYLQRVERSAASHAGPDSKLCTEPSSQVGFPNSAEVAQAESSGFHVTESCTQRLLVITNKLSVGKESADWRCIPTQLRLSKKSILLRLYEKYTFPLGWRRLVPLFTVYCRTKQIHPLHGICSIHRNRCFRTIIIFNNMQKNFMLQSYDEKVFKRWESFCFTTLTYVTGYCFHHGAQPLLAVTPVSNDLFAIHTATLFNYESMVNYTTTNGL